MGLKIMHTADWHMGSPFVSFEEGQRRFLRQEQLKIPEKIAQICHREHCDLVLLAGDVFDGMPDRETVDAVKRGLEECHIPVFISPGNHDFCGSGSVWLDECWPENVKVFTGELDTVVVRELSCRIYGAGYRSMDCDPLLEGFRVQGKERYQIAVLHGDPLTPQSPYCPVTTTQVRDSGLDYLALGHIHKSGMFRAGSTLCAWPGCPMGRGWDETGEKGIFIADLEQNADVRFIPLDAPGFYDMTADVSEGAEETMNRILPPAGSRDFFRITMTGQTAADAESLRHWHEKFPNLLFRDHTEEMPDLWENAGSDTFRGIYFHLLQQQAQSNPRAELAAEISRRILSGMEMKLP